MCDVCACGNPRLSAGRGVTWMGYEECESERGAWVEV
jgi:hypothetical protein